MSDWYNSVLCDETDSRLKTYHKVIAGRTYDRAIGLSPDGRRTEIRSRRCTGARARATGIEIEAIGVAGKSAARAPTIKWGKAAEVSPLRKVRFPQDNCTL